MSWKCQNTKESPKSKLTGSMPQAQCDECTDVIYCLQYWTSFIGLLHPISSLTYTQKSDALYQIDISMSNCTSNWQLFSEMRNIALELKAFLCFLKVIFCLYVGTNSIICTKLGSKFIFYRVSVHSPGRSKNRILSKVCSHVFTCRIKNTCNNNQHIILLWITISAILRGHPQVWMVCFYLW